MSDQRLYVKIGPEHPACLSASQRGAQLRNRVLLQERTASSPAVDQMPEDGGVGDEQLGGLADDPVRLLSRVLIGGESEAGVELAQQRVAERRPLPLSRPDEVEDRRRGEVGPLGDALDGRRLVGRLAQQLADRVENALAALLLVALTQAG
jgi:hypothetical protein